MNNIYSLGAAYDKLEEALGKFDDGPFFLGQFSLVRTLSAMHFNFYLSLISHGGDRGSPTWVMHVIYIDRVPYERLVLITVTFDVYYMIDTQIHIHICNHVVSSYYTFQGFVMSSSLYVCLMYVSNVHASKDFKTLPSFLDDMQPIYFP